MRVEDALPLFAIKSDPDVTYPYAADPHPTIARTEEWIEELLRSYEEGTAIFWVITPRRETSVLGSITLWNLDLKSKRSEMGYELKKPAWGKGYATESGASVLDCGFRRIGLNRIEACPFDDNPASKKMLERLGFTLEGKLRERVLFKGKFKDQLYYSILMREWEASRSS